MPSSPFENPYEAPEDTAPAAGPRIEVPPDFGGKLGLGFLLLLKNLPVITAVVLTVWLPANVVIDSLVSHSADPDNPFATVRLSSVVQAFFGPLITGAVVWVLAERMEGRKATYPAAMGVGLRSWGPLFAARIVAGFLTALGLLALIVPGVVLAVRFALIDPVVVLEGAGVAESRRRSRDIVRADPWPVFMSFLFYFAVTAAVAVAFISAGVIVSIFEGPGFFENPWITLAFECLLDVQAELITCVLFLYYWESRRRNGRHPEGDDAGQFP